jgi:hypothetical protein
VKKINIIGASTLAALEGNLVMTQLPNVLRRAALQILTVSLALTSTGYGNPVILYQHAGSTAPTTEGWSVLISPGTSAGPINDSGTPVWSISNSSEEQYGFYSAVPTAAEVLAASLGWSLKITLRVAWGDGSTRSVPARNYSAGNYAEVVFSVPGVTAHLATSLKQQGVITGEQEGAINSCAGQSSIGK